MSLKNNLLKIYKTDINSVKVTSDLKEDIYDELSIKSVSDLYNLIIKYSPITEKTVFVDVGSGLGKLACHIAIVSQCKKIVGIEKNKERCKISKKLFKTLEGVEKKSFKVINDDILNVKDFGDVAYINDLNFPSKYTLHIWNNLKANSLMITHKQINKSYPIGRMLFKMHHKKEPFWGLIYRKPNTDGGIPSKLGININI